MAIKEGNDVVDFCDRKQAEVNAAMTEIEKLFKIGGLNYKAAMGLAETYSINLGRLMAFKEVIDWMKRDE